MSIHKLQVSGLLLLAGIFQARTMAQDDAKSWDGTIIQHGKMHEAIGKQQHQGRVQLKALLEKPHFFGVAALAKLDGEATIHDGKVTITRVDAKGQLEPVAEPAADAQATLLVGAYVPSWTERKVAKAVKPEGLDEHLAGEASKAGLKTSAPFVFTADGEFSNLRLHVIHGACPIHARLKKIELPKEQKPVEVEMEKVRGTIVGVFAKDAVGSITHPATSTHMHLLYRDARSGKTVTGHVEQIGFTEGSVLRLPKSN
jgi:alpha-acetolactate decarboxylase